MIFENFRKKRLYKAAVNHTGKIVKALPDTTPDEKAELLDAAAGWARTAAAVQLSWGQDADRKGIDCASKWTAKAAVYTALAEYYEGATEYVVPAGLGEEIGAVYTATSTAALVRALDALSVELGGDPVLGVLALAGLPKDRCTAYANR